MVINTSFVLLLENLVLTLVNKCIRFCVICMTKKAVNTDKYRLVRDYTYGCIYPKRVATIPYCRCPCPICSECIGLWKRLTLNIKSDRQLQKEGKNHTLEFRFMCTSSERTGVRNCATKVSGFSGPNDIHTKVRIWWISHALASYSS